MNKYGEDMEGIFTAMFRTIITVLMLCAAAVGLGASIRVVVYFFMLGWRVL